MSFLNPISYSDQTFIWRNNQSSGPSKTPQPFSDSPISYGFHPNYFEILTPLYNNSLLYRFQNTSQNDRLNPLTLEGRVNAEYSESEKLTPADKKSMRDSYLKHESWSGVYLKFYEGGHLFHADLFPNIILCTFKKNENSQLVYDFQIKLRNSNFQKINRQLVKITKLMVCDSEGYELFKYNLNKVKIESSKDLKGVDDSLIIKVKHQIFKFRNSKEAVKFSGSVKGKNFLKLNKKKKFLYVELMNMTFKVPVYTRPFSFFNTSGRPIISNVLDRNKFFNFLMEVKPELVQKNTFVPLPIPNQFIPAVFSDSCQFSIEAVEELLEPSNMPIKKRLFQNSGLGISSCEERPVKKQNISNTNYECQLIKAYDPSELEGNLNDLLILPSSIDPLNDFYEDDTSPVFSENIFREDDFLFCDKF